MVRIGRETDKKTVTADASLDTEIPLGSGCRLVYICNAILITLSIFDTDYSAVSADSVWICWWNWRNRNSADEIDETGDDPCGGKSRMTRDFDEIHTEISQIPLMSSAGSKIPQMTSDWLEFRQSRRPEPPRLPFLVLQCADTKTPLIITIIVPIHNKIGILGKYY